MLKNLWRKETNEDNTGELEGRYDGRTSIRRPLQWLCGFKFSLKLAKKKKKSIRRS